MIMGKHEEIEGLLGDLPFATIERGPNERIDHFDQRGGSDNGIKLVEHQRFEGLTLIAQEPFGACQPEVAFSLMVALWLRPRLVEEMLMVPGQYEKLTGLVRHHGTEFRISCFGLCKRGDKVIEMLGQGRERCGNGGAIKLCDHLEKPREFRAYSFSGAQSAMRRADV